MATAGGEDIKGKALRMEFARIPRGQFANDCHLDVLSREPPPPLPGGYKLGESLYYIGNSGKTTYGESVLHGQQVEVVGLVLGAHTTKGLGLAVQFPFLPCSQESKARLPASRSVRKHVCRVWTMLNQIGCDDGRGFL